MSAIEYRYIEPLDVLFLRGNKLFGDPGSYGEALIPPWPSVAAGAIRSRMLVDDAVDLGAFARNHAEHPTLGTPMHPGSFTLSGFYLARKRDGEVEILLPLPADLSVSRGTDAALKVSRLTPQPIGLASSYPLGMLPVLAQGARRSKPEHGYLLTQQGWQAYLRGDTPSTEQLVPSSALWSLDARIGIGMNAATRSAEEGKLFSAQAIVMKKDVGFLAAVSGAQPPKKGLLRFGGDGRAATIENIDTSLPTPDYQAIANAQRCRIVLTSPGLFPHGWMLPGTDNNKRVALPGGVTAKVVSAVVPRAETISGWDLAAREGKGAPKPAQRVTPAGSVYWLDELQATPEQLSKLVENGLWSSPCEDESRRAEGFNRFIFATF